MGGDRGRGAQEAVPPGVGNVGHLEHTVHPTECKGSVKQARQAMAVVVISRK